MIRGEVPEALAVLDATGAKPQKLAYALAKGRIQLKAIAREIEAHRADAYTPEVLAYLRGREALGLEHAARGEDGQPIAQGGGVKLQDPAAYRAALEAYEAAHADARGTFEAQDRAFRDWLSQPVALEPHRVDPELIPEDVSLAEAELYMELLAWELVP